MIVKKDEIIRLFNAHKSGNKGWYVADCPLCGKPEHLGIIFGNPISSFRCVKCGETGSIWVILNKVKRLDLLDRRKQISLEDKLINKISIDKEEKEVIDLTLPSKSKPIGFKRLSSDKYLESRGFTQEQFEIFWIGETKLHPKLKQDYIIILIIVGGECKGYLARSRKSKEWIDNYNLKIKQHNLQVKLSGIGEKKEKYLRWINSSDTDFEKILLGSEEIVENETKTIILVEGFTSKANIDRLFNLYKSPEIKCCCSFGKKISKYQIKILQDKKIENIIVLYDPDAVKEIKSYSNDLSKYFNTEVGWITQKNSKGELKDPGDLNFEEAIEVFNNLEDPINFTLNKVEKKKLI